MARIVEYSCNDDRIESVFEWEKVLKKLEQQLDERGRMLDDHILHMGQQKQKLADDWDALEKHKARLAEDQARLAQDQAELKSQVIAVDKEHHVFTQNMATLQPALRAFDAESPMGDKRTEAFAAKIASLRQAIRAFGTESTVVDAESTVVDAESTMVNTKQAETIARAWRCYKARVRLANFKTQNAFRMVSQACLGRFESLQLRPQQEYGKAILADAAICKAMSICALQNNPNAKPLQANVDYADKDQRESALKTIYAAILTTRTCNYVDKLAMMVRMLAIGMWNHIVSSNYAFYSDHAPEILPLDLEDGKGMVYSFNLLSTYLLKPACVEVSDDLPEEVKAHAGLSLGVCEPDKLAKVQERRTNNLVELVTNNPDTFFMFQECNYSTAKALAKNECQVKFANTRIGKPTEKSPEAIAKGQEAVYEIATAVNFLPTFKDVPNEAIIAFAEARSKAQSSLPDTFKLVPATPSEEEECLWGNVTIVPPKYDIRKFFAFVHTSSNGLYTVTVAQNPTTGQTVVLVNLHHKLFGKIENPELFASNLVKFLKKQLPSYCFEQNAAFMFGGDCNALKKAPKYLKPLEDAYTAFHHFAKLMNLEGVCDPKSTSQLSYGQGPMRADFMFVSPTLLRSTRTTRDAPEETHKDTVAEVIEHMDEHKSGLLWAGRTQCVLPKYELRTFGDLLRWISLIAFYGEAFALAMARNGVLLEVPTNAVACLKKGKVPVAEVKSVTDQWKLRQFRDFCFANAIDPQSEYAQTAKICSLMVKIPSKKGDLTRFNTKVAPVDEVFFLSPKQNKGYSEGSKSERGVHFIPFVMKKDAMAHDEEVSKHALMLYISFFFFPMDGSIHMTNAYQGSDSFPGGKFKQTIAAMLWQITESQTEGAAAEAEADADAARTKFVEDFGDLMGALVWTPLHGERGDRITVPRMLEILKMTPLDKMDDVVSQETASLQKQTDYNKCHFLTLFKDCMSVDEHAELHQEFFNSLAACLSALKVFQAVFKTLGSAEAQENNSCGLARAIEVMERLKSIGL